MSGVFRGSSVGVSVALESEPPLRGSSVGVQVFEEGNPALRGSSVGTHVFFVARDVAMRATNVGVQVFMDIAPDPHARPPEVFFFE